jgi:hypothetical protein
MSLPVTVISVGFGTADRDPLRDLVDHVVAVTERELQVLALHRGAVTDAGDFELLLEALGDAFDQIRDLGASGTVQRPRAIGLDPRVHLDLAALELHFNVAMNDELKLALRPLHLDGLPIDGRGNARRHRHWPLADT